MRANGLHSKNKMTKELKWKKVNVVQETNYCYQALILGNGCKLPVHNAPYNYKSHDFSAS